MYKFKCLLIIVFCLYSTIVLSQDYQLKLCSEDSIRFDFRLIYKDHRLNSVNSIVKINLRDYKELKNKIVRLVDESGKIIGDDNSNEDCIKLIITKPKYFNHLYQIPDEFNLGETLEEMFSSRNQKTSTFQIKIYKKEYRK